VQIFYFLGEHHVLKSLNKMKPQSPKKNKVDTYGVPVLQLFIALLFQQQKCVPLPFYHRQLMSSSSAVYDSIYIKFLWVTRTVLSLVTLGEVLQKEMILCVLHHPRYPGQV
jgi:hypothetical protein